MQLQIALNSGRAEQVNAERLVNIYAEESGGKSRVKLTGTPGLSLFANVGSLPVRGMSEHAGSLYVVTDRLWRVSRFGSTEDLGAIAGTGQVVMSSNGTQLCIIGANSYIYQTSLVEITDEDFPGATSVDFMDGYFIFGNGTGQFFLSALYDGTDIDALDFASAESNPDPIIRVFVDHRELILFGSETTEIWVNTGGSDFPFERNPGAINEKGICGPYACARLDNSVVWIDQHGIVRRMASGYTPQRISTHEVERALAESTSLERAEAFSYVQEGHEFFVLTAPGAGTWVFDAATSLWHERQSFGDTRWRARGYCFCYEKHLVGDYLTGRVYELDYSRFDENGTNMLAEVIFPPVFNEAKRFRAHSVVLDMEHGETAPYGESQVRLDLSGDAQDWQTVGYGSMGRTGNRVTRTVWRRLGQHRNLHLRFRISDPVRRTIYAAYAELEGDG